MLEVYVLITPSWAAYIILDINPSLFSHLLFTKNKLSLLLRLDS